MAACSTAAGAVIPSSSSASARHLDCAGLRLRSTELLEVPHCFFGDYGARLFSTKMGSNMQNEGLNLC
jgi:hypothetical protein